MKNFGKKFVFLGSPGAGKGTVAKSISSKYGVLHLSTGDIMRQEINANTTLGLKVKSLVESGLLVPDELVLELVKNRLAKEDASGTCILDGFPRTLAQAEGVEKFQKINTAVFFEVSEEEVIKRLSGRRIHKSSGRIYHILFNPPKVEGKDDITGEALSIRDDDCEEVIKKRLEDYREQSYPLVQFYKDKGILKVLDANREPQLVIKDVEKLFEDLN